VNKWATVLLWGLICAAGAAGFTVLALTRETVNAIWMLVAAICTYAIGYRLYSRLLANKVFG
jgi:carbon starvation protein